MSAQDQDGLGNYASQMAQLAGGGGIEKACQTMKSAGYTSQSVNDASAGVCYHSKSTCISVCDENATQVRSKLLNQCGFNPETHNASSLTGDCRTLYNAYTTIGEQMLTCQKLGSNVAAMKTQSAHGNQAMQLANFCKNQSSTNAADTGFEQNPQVFSQVDCSVTANQTDPRCRDCTNPAMANSPMCIQANNTAKATDGSSVNVVGSRPNFGSRSSDFNTGDARGNTQQTANLDGEGKNKLGQQTASTPGIPGGGGGGAGALGAGGAGAGPSLGRGGSSGSGAGGGGYNTDVLRDASGGGGANFGGKANVVTGALAESPAGGGFQYGEAGDREPASDNGLLDLKQYLPGGKKDPTRKLAGTGRVAADPSLAGETTYLDIWFRLSFRYRVLCNMKKLDCPPRASQPQ